MFRRTVCFLVPRVRVKKDEYIKYIQQLQKKNEKSFQKSTQDQNREWLEMYMKTKKRK